MYFFACGPSLSFRTTQEMHQTKYNFLAACVLFIFSLLIWRNFHEPDSSDLFHSNSTDTQPHTQDRIIEHDENHINESTVEDPERKYAPMRMHECTPSMPKHYAPCLALELRNAVAGEELIYPSFTITEPIFAVSRSNDSGNWWDMAEDMLADRAYRRGKNLIYDEKHGQIIVSSCISHDPILYLTLRIHSRM